MKEYPFKLKLIFPCRFERYNPHSDVSSNSLPYGMGVLTAFLRGHNYYVQQEDLAIKFNNCSNSFLRLSFRIFKNILLDNDRNYEGWGKFLKSGEMNPKLALFIDRILDSSSLEGFDAIGFSIFSFAQFEFVLMLAQRLRQRTNVTIVLGGPFITLFSELFYPNIFRFVDYLIVGDGRIPLLRLLEHLQGKTSLSSIPNLIYKNNGKVIANPREHYPIEDIPIPDFDGLPIELYVHKHLPYLRHRITLPYQISKGCVSRCSFCTFPNVERRLEFKSYDKVITELSQMKERYKSKIFYLCDSTINNSYDYLEGLCDLFIKNKLNIKWHVHAKVGNLDRRILSKMKEAGCIRLTFGIESGSNRILKSMHKGFTIEQANQTIKDTAEAGIKVEVSLITGYPYETGKDIKKTAEFIKRNKKYILKTWVGKFNLIHGSSIYSYPERYGVNNFVPPPHIVSFGFDETNGLKWEQKQKQQDYSNRQVLKAVYLNIAGNKVHELFILACVRFFQVVMAKIKRKRF